MIHVCFGLYDKSGTYSKFTGTTMLSVFENSNTFQKLPSITIHILHDNTLTLDNREKFSYLAGQYNQLVKFYNVEELCADKVEEIIKLTPQLETSRFSVGAMYRLLIPQILPQDIDKVIYFDSDIIVNLDLKELWQVELGDKSFAAADEIKADSFSHPINAAKNYLVTSGLVEYSDYFNSGVLLMNLKLLRDKENLIMDGVKFIGENPQLVYLDQEVLNYLFSKNYLKLDEKFNFFVREARFRKETNCKRKIYHYAGESLEMNLSDPFNRLWMKYFSETPWFGAEAIGRLYASVRQMNIGLKNFMIQISAAMSGKTRAFFTVPANVDALKKIFRIRDDEEIFLAENQSSLQKLIDAMKKSRGKKVFFILMLGFPFQALTEAGFVFGKDFFNVIEFLSEANGLPFFSHPFLKAM